MTVVTGGPAQAGIAPDTAVQATNTHYDLPPEYFAAFLDRRLKYSSGIYDRPGVSLEEAQTAKLHFVAQRLGLVGGECVLDIGCGWGSLPLFLATEYGCEVVGVTPAANQAAFINARAAELGVSHSVEIMVGRFSDLAIDGKYDAATMLGSIIHMPDRAVVLRKIFDLLQRSGKLYVSESAFRSAEVYDEFAARPGTRHVTETIFGFADLVPFSTLIAAVESGGFSLDALDDLTANYHRTIEDWIDRAVRNRAQVEAAVPGSSDALIRYLETANAAWGYTSKHYALTASKTRLGAKIVPS